MTTPPSDYPRRHPHGTHTHRATDYDGIIPPSPTDKDIIESNAVLTARMDEIVTALNRRAIKTDVDRAQKKSWRAIIGIYGIWIVELAIVLYIYSVSYTSDARSACQSRVNAFANSEASYRSKAATKQNDAQDTLIDEILKPDSTPTTRRDALARYKDVGKETKAEREAHPVPTETCADI